MPTMDYAASMTLSEAPLGAPVRIHHLRARPEVSKRLRELGLCEDAVVSCIMKGHGNIICALRNTRIGLDRHLAGSILVSSDE